MKNKGKFKINSKLIKELKNILDQHVIGINNITRYNNGLFEKISKKLEKKLDKKELPVSVYAIDSVGDQTNIKFSSQRDANTFIYRDTDGRAQINKPVSNDDIANKQYVDEQIIAPGFVTKEYVDTRDQEILTESKQYTDDKDSEQKTYIDEQDENTLNNAKEYADTQDEIILNNAKEYTDEGLNNKVEKLKLANKVYITNGAGADTSRDLSASANPNSIPVRNGQGNFQVSSPVNESDVATKKYVDDNVISKGEIKVGQWVILGESVKEKTPLQIFGYGLWSDVAEKYGEGALRVALNNYDIIGSDTITQTENQMAEHNHYFGQTIIQLNGGGNYVTALGTTQTYVSKTGQSIPMVNIQKSINIRVLEREA